MDEIKQSRGEVKELKRRVSAVHERTTCELAQKITKSSYQFKKKANEIQFNFNSGVEESIVAVKKELEKIEATGEQEEPVKKAATLLDEGLKALERRQKHIKVADRSEFGWATVEHYDSHPLAADSDDKKHLEKAEKEVERAANKRRKGTGAAGTKKKSLAGGAVSSFKARETPVAIPPPLLPQAPSSPPRVPALGRCFSCGQYGHLARTCPKKTVYPLIQPVATKAESIVYPSNGVDKQASLRFPLLKWQLKGVLMSTMYLRPIVIKVLITLKISMD